jgi:hypothetical protein
MDDLNVSSDPSVLPSRPQRITPYLLLLTLFLSESLYFSLLRFHAINGLKPVLIFLGIIAALFALYGAGYWIIRKSPAGRASLLIIIAGAVLMRVTLLPAGLPPDLSLNETTQALREDVGGAAVTYERFQLYDDDIWRYLWDGYVQALGINPYQYAPTNERFDELSERNETWSAIRDHINYADTPTIYPPLAQSVFRLSHALAPGSVLMMKSVVVMFDLLAMAFIVLTLQLLGRSLNELILYAWNPLVIKVFAGSGHIDGVLVAAIAAMMYFALRKWRGAVALAFAAAILAKLSPVLLLPLMLRRIGWRYTMLTLLTVVIGYLPFANAGSALFAGFRQFARDWQFNSGLFVLIKSLLAFTVNDPSVIARSLCAVIIIAVTLWMSLRDDGSDQSFISSATLTLGTLVICSPAVMPWYITWLLPLALIARQAVWFYFSALVCLAFLVMIDERERAAVLWIEYGAVALIALYTYRNKFNKHLKPLEET